MNDTNALATTEGRVAPELTPYQVIEAVVSSGDIGRMTPAQRVAFYWRTCETLGLNPLTQPFQYLSLSGKMVLYATKSCTEQLRRVNRVSVTGLTRETNVELGTYTVFAAGSLPDGRTDSASGVVNVKGLSGEALANALMKAETKAKRRLTLSLCGLGFLDESEIEGIGDRLDVDPSTGEIKERPKPPSLLETVQAQASALASEQAAAGGGTAEAPSEPEGATTTPPSEEPSILAQPMTAEESAKISGVDEPDEERAAVEDVEDQGVSEGQLVAEPDAMDDLVATAQEDAEQTDAAIAAAPEAEKPAPVEPEKQKAADPSAAPGLTIQALADLARQANIGKMRFASVLDIVPADVGKKIEEMSDEQRWSLALQLGLVG